MTPLTCFGALCMADPLRHNTSGSSGYDIDNNSALMYPSLPPLHQGSSLRPGYVRVAVDVHHATHLPLLIRSLRRLHVCHPYGIFETSPPGDHLLGASSPEHLRVMISDLMRDLGGVLIRISDMITTLRETITQPSSERALVKSPNKANRLWMSALPMGTRSPSLLISH
jgi:translation elongation factor EF-G